MQLIPVEKCAHRARLSADGKRLYDAMAKEMVDRGRSATISGRYDDPVTEVFEALLWDQPFLFDLDRKQVSIATCDAYTRVEWRYRLSDVQAASYRERIYREISNLRARIPREGQALRREWEIHRLMQCMGVRTHVADEGAWWNHSIAGPLLFHETVCEGAALLFYLLCLLEGVPCQVITGTSCGRLQEGGGHAWNLVRLGDSYTHVDVYWDMCLYDEAMGCSYDYFNLPDRQIRLDHRWDEDRYPRTGTDRYSWFIMKGCEVHAVDGFRQLLRRCRDAEATQMMARFRILPSEGELRRAAEQTLFDGRNGRLVWRINPDQQVIQLAVTYA